MAKKLLPWVIVLILALTCSKGPARSGTITVVNVQNDALFSKILRAFDVKFSASKQDVIIDLDERAITGLREYCRILRTGMNIVSTNIANATSTRTSMGQPYIRQILSLDDARTGYAVSDDQTAFRYVYDPSHPDSIKSGQNRGYVKYPNVDIVREMETMIDYSRKFEETRRLLLQIDPKTIIF